MKYRKHEDPALDAEYGRALWYGNVRVGEKGLFYRKLLSIHYIPMDNVVRAYRRVEEVRGRTGCCSNDFSIHRLILTENDGTETAIKIGESMYRHEPEQLMAALKEKFPAIVIGKAE